ncbi:DUF308 domain-containing protein [Nakamurella flavida]|uniref:DUF308 domain-containing protein n=1 Tax=Nakamurella flavida TaxID=363630 RepID=A0A938YFM1_9ACTN|nr:DUF308 domain-containing protein [Nakamurella flavida]MBM9474997.1 DUF308 domain-containing protein [Nakamurella flavida]MDP9776566.1 uncharacterized membrane protein HdeD (DUF308 family) [Nakamurella flavida]
MSTDLPGRARTRPAHGNPGPGGTVDPPAAQSPRALAAQAVLGVAVGIVAILWPGITLGAVVLVFAVFAFGASALALASLITPAGRRSWVSRLVLALLHLISGVVVLAWPGLTVTVLVVLIASWALISGVLEIVVGLSGGGWAPGHSAGNAVSGVLSLALGIVLLLAPGTGAIGLVQVFGFFAMVSGLAALVTLPQALPGR